MFKIKLFCFLLFFYTTMQTFAQDVVIVSGIIIDQETSIPLAGVSVRIKGTKLGAVTDEKGFFKINSTQTKNILIISSVGTEEKEYNFLNPKNTIPIIKLQSSINALKDIIVVGYNQVDRKKLTGAVGSYSPNLIGNNDLSVDVALQGRVAGVLIGNSSGTPGAATSITIRGLTSLNSAGNSPLIVLDGVPIYSIDRTLNNVEFSKQNPPFRNFGEPSQAQAYTSNSEFERNPLANINVDDIESIEILKDAYATSIYGSRGAAGVILITTKKGKENKSNLSFNLSSSVVSSPTLPTLLTGNQYADFYKTLYDTLSNNANNIGSFFWPPTAYNFNKKFNTNWLNEITQVGQGYDASVSLSGGNDKTTYYMSGAYNKTASYIKNSDLERISFRINLTTKINNSFKLGGAFSVSKTDNSALNAQTAYRNAYTKAPNLPIYDTNGLYLWNANYSSNNQINSLIPNVDNNPVADLYANVNTLSDARIIANFFTEIKITSWLNYKLEFGVDWFNSRNYSRLFSRPAIPTGSAKEGTNNNFKYVVNNLLNFNKKWGYHRISGVVGQTFETSTENNIEITGTNFTDDRVLSILAASDRKVINALQQQWAIVSFLGRIDYAFNDKYLLGITNRIDGSSRFSANNRYVNFPSASLGWIINKENFLINNRWISELKIRTSIGTTGTQAGNGYYGTQGQYTITPYNYGGTNINASVPQNPNLKWQTTTNFDAGLDVGIFNNTIKFSIDYYNRQTTNLLLSSGVPGYTGFNLIDQNIGELKNSGFEFTIHSNNFENKHFKWNTFFTLSTNSNTITKLYKTDALLSAQNAELANGRFWQEGGSASSFTLFEWVGINPINGNPIWKGKEGTSEIPYPQLFSNVNDKDANLQRNNLGNSQPDFYGGLENRFQIDNFEFSIYFTYSFGNKIINGTKASLYNYASVDVPNLSPDVLNYWKKNGDITSIPGLFNASNYVIINESYTITDYTVGTNSSRFLEDGSFVRLKNISLAYTLPNSLKTKLGIKGNFKFYIEANNVFIITKYTGIDPEVNAFGSNALQGGYDQTTLPAPRIFKVGLKINF